MDVRHRLIIRHPRDGTILGHGDADNYELPVIVTDDRHTAEVDYINATVLTEFGLATTVLRSVTHSDAEAAPVVRVHDLQTHGAARLHHEHIHWVSRSAAFAPLDRAALDAWRAVGTADDATEWAQPNWFADVSRWIERTIEAAGLGPIDSIAQLRVWEFSSVLRVVAADSEYYFKALPSNGGREFAATQYLASRFPDALPRLIATEPGRHWLLLAACAGRKLEDCVDADAWTFAAARYGRLQVDCIAHVPALRALDCPLHDLGTLAQRIEPLFNDTEALCIDQPSGLSKQQVDQLQRLVPTLRHSCEQLAAVGVPLTLEHGDLWPGNLFVDGEHCAIIDWEDVAIAHPFFSLAPLTVGLRNGAAYTPELLTRLESAYLAAFAGMASNAHLRGALHLAAPLGFIDMAIHYRRQRPSVVALHPWMRDLVPEALRLALARVDVGSN